MSTSNILRLVWENLIFFSLATAFIAIMGWNWRNLKPFSLPEALPNWFKYWFGTIQFIGIVLPVIALIIWGFWQGYNDVIIVLTSYLIMLVLQIASEILTLKKFHSVVWVTVPYLYLPYRFWQLYEGLNFIPSTENLILVRYLLILNLIVWIANYILDLAQLPRLFRWDG